MDNRILTLRVAARFMRADQQPGARQEAKKLVKPVNPPKGISRETVKEYVKTEADGNDETVTPDRRDIRPEDVFQPKPKHMSVLNLAQSGKDMDKALRNQVPRDKGWDTVRNLSQYLVRTDGGGGTKPVGKK